MAVKHVAKKIMTNEKNLKVSKDAHTRAKIASLEDDVTLHDWIECAIELAIKERGKLRRMLDDRAKRKSSRQH